MVVRRERAGRQARVQNATFPGRHVLLGFGWSGSDHSSASAGQLQLA
jgi:hypothetical protein